LPEVARLLALLSLLADQTIAIVGSFDDQSDGIKVQIEIATYRNLLEGI
jgi:hypothetical protein